MTQPGTHRRLANERIGSARLVHLSARDDLHGHELAATAPRQEDFARRPGAQALEDVESFQGVARRFARKHQQPSPPRGSARWQD